MSDARASAFCSSPMQRWPVRMRFWAASLPAYSAGRRGACRTGRSSRWNRWVRTVPDHGAVHAVIFRTGADLGADRGQGFAATPFARAAARLFGYMKTPAPTSPSCRGLLENRDVDPPAHQRARRGKTANASADNGGTKWLGRLGFLGHSTFSHFLARNDIACVGIRRHRPLVVSAPGRASANRRSRKEEPRRNLSVWRPDNGTAPR